MKKATITLCILSALSLLIGCGEEPERLEGQEQRSFTDFLFWCFTSFWRWLGLVILAGAVAGAIAGAVSGGRSVAEKITKSVRKETERIDQSNRRIEDLAREVRELHTDRELE